MASEFINALSVYGADVKGALGRMLNKEEMYSKFLRKFREDKSMDELRRIFTKSEADRSPEDFQQIFHLAHTVKGVAANLGLTSIANESSEICEKTRSGNTDPDALKGLGEMFYRLDEDYRELIGILNRVLQ
ncbi:MAG: Hpt domain-containing protein [Ruminococcus sp.]|jgi:HPt (histidine-containing phosphotransfer) domain-containing protein|nr:Hpt domain-containing protein [Ruminococcus sp.]